MVHCVYVMLLSSIYSGELKLHGTRWRQAYFSQCWFRLKTLFAILTFLVSFDL